MPYKHYKSLRGTDSYENGTGEREFPLYSGPMTSYGPCSDAVEALLSRMAMFPWLQSVGAELTSEGQVLRGDLRDLASSPKAEGRWGSRFGDARAAVAAAYRDANRFDLYDAIFQAARATVTLDASVLDTLDARYGTDGGYFGDTMLLPREIVGLPLAIPTAAALEAGVSDVAPSLAFFRELLPWFARGHYPLGMSPDEQLIVW